MVPETLLYFDEEALFIYYNMEGTKRLPFGLRNYLATTTIDVLSPTRSRVTCSGRFDLPADVPRDTVKDFLENVYGGIIYGIEYLILRSNLPLQSHHRPLPCICKLP